MRLLEFDSYNSEILKLLVTYSHSSENLNTNISFKSVSNILNLFESAIEIRAIIEEYSKSINSHLEKLKTANKQIQKALIDEINTFPQCSLIVINKNTQNRNK